MKKNTKILLSIPSIVSLFFFLTYFIEPTVWGIVIDSMTKYYIAICIVQSLMIIQLVYLLNFLWKSNNFVKSTKVNWTWLLVLFTSIASLFFIWKKIDEFEITSKQ